MKPLIVLLSVFGISILVLKSGTENIDFALAARLAMSGMMLFSAIGHFIFTKGMTLMIPEFIPFKKQIIYLTGILEILFAIGLLLAGFQVLIAWSMILFLILLLPANIYAAFRKVDLQKANFHGNGLNYLWFRIPLQILFIVWIYLSSIKN